MALRPITGSEPPPLLGARVLVVRTAFLFAFGVALIVLFAATEDRGLRAVVPLFLLYLFVELAPTIWPREVDLCAPVVLPGIIGAFVSVGTLASFYDYGELKLDLIPMLTPERTEELVSASLYALILGQLSYYVGYYSRFGVSMRRIFPSVAGLVWDRRRLLLVGVVAFGIFIVSYTVFQILVGVPLLDFTQLGEGKKAWHDDPSLSWMLRGIYVGMLPAFLYFARSFSGRRAGTIVTGLAGVFIALLMSRIGIRGPAAYALVTLLFIAHYLYRRVPVMVFVALYFAGITMSNIAYQWRTAPTSAPRDLVIGETFSNPTHVLVAHETERQRFSSVAVVMDTFPDKHPYLVGESYLSLGVLLVPRWLWPEKTDFFQWQDTRIVTNITGAPVPTPFIAALYANLSWLGIFVGMFLYGAFHRGLYEWLRLHSRDANVVILYAVTMNYFQPTLLGVSAALTYVPTIYVILRFIGRKPASAALQPT